MEDPRSTVRLRTDKGTRLCPFCGAYAGRCETDTDDGATICGITGHVIPYCPECTRPPDAVFRTAYGVNCLAHPFHGPLMTEAEWWKMQKYNRPSAIRLLALRATVYLGFAIGCWLMTYWLVLLVNYLTRRF